MMNKKGAVVLRDIVFMMVIVSCIFVLSGLYVSEMALNYENDEMSNEWASSGINVSGTKVFNDSANNLTNVGSELGNKSTGLLSLIGLSGVASGLEGLGNALSLVFTAPNTIGGLVGSTLNDAGAGTTVAGIIKYLIIILLWVVVIFTVISAFLRGGKL